MTCAKYSLGIWGYFSEDKSFLDVAIAELTPEKSYDAVERKIIKILPIGVDEPLEKIGSIERD